MFMRAWHVLRLLKVTAIILVNKNEIEVVFHAELLVVVLIRGREVKRAQEEADGDGLAAHGGAIHDLELGDGLTLIINIWRGTLQESRSAKNEHGIGKREGTSRFPLNQRDFHIFDFNSDKQEVNLADNGVLGEGDIRARHKPTKETEIKPAGDISSGHIRTRCEGNPRYRPPS